MQKWGTHIRRWIDAGRWVLSVETSTHNLRANTTHTGNLFINLYAENDIFLLFVHRKLHRQWVICVFIIITFRTYIRAHVALVWWIDRLSWSLLESLNNLYFLRWLNHVFPCQSTWKLASWWCKSVMNEAALMMMNCRLNSSDNTVTHANFSEINIHEWLNSCLLGIPNQNFEKSEKIELRSSPHPSEHTSLSLWQ